MKLAGVTVVGNCHRLKALQVGTTRIPHVLPCTCILWLRSPPDRGRLYAFLNLTTTLTRCGVPPLQAIHMYMQDITELDLFGIKVHLAACTQRPSLPVASLAAQ